MLVPYGGGNDLTKSLENADKILKLIVIIGRSRAGVSL